MEHMQNPKFPCDIRSGLVKAFIILCSHLFSCRIIPQWRKSSLPANFFRRKTMYHCKTSLEAIKSRGHAALTQLITGCKKTDFSFLNSSYCKGYVCM